MPDKSNTSRAFSARLRAAMQARGLVSPGARSGVDVAALAQAAGTSYEMARRYAEGSALPRADKMDAIARWLGLSPAALLWGGAEPVDLGALEKCLAAVQDAQHRIGRTLSTEQAARLVALLYQEAMSGRFPEPSTIDLLVRA